MAKAEQATVDLLGDTIEYEARTSDDATEPRIDVDIHGVRVVIPTEEDVSPATLLKENAAWVLEKKDKFDTYSEQIPERNFTEGATFPYGGTEYKIVIESRSASAVDEETQTLRLAAHHVDETSVKRALETLYRRKARKIFESCADRYANEMGVEYRKIEIRNQRTKWGSCSTEGTLGLNWRLMMAPSEIVDYIIIHELAHLREPNHTDSFWSLVAEHDPEYEAHIQWLEENSTQLIFSEQDV